MIFNLLILVLVLFYKHTFHKELKQACISLNSSPCVEGTLICELMFHIFHLTVFYIADFDLFCLFLHVNVHVCIRCKFK